MATAREANITSAQAEMLKAAARESKWHKAGRFSTGRIPRKTVETLKEKGFISLELDHTPEEIAAFNLDRDGYIAQAKDLLNSGEWRPALTLLQDAEREERKAKFQTWQLTDKGWEFVRAAA